MADDTLTWESLIAMSRRWGMHVEREDRLPPNTASLSVPRLLWERLMREAPQPEPASYQFCGLPVDTVDYLPPNMIACRDGSGRVIGMVLLTDSYRTPGEDGK